MKSAAYRKMRLVPFAEDDGTADQRQERVRTYDPTVNVMADLLPHIVHPGASIVAAKSKSKAKTKTTRKVASRSRAGATTAAQALRSARLREYKSLQLQRSATSNIADVTQPPAAGVVVPEVETITLPADIVPRMYRSKLSRLLDIVSKSAGSVSRTNADELVIDGVVHRGTSFTGALRSLYVNTTSPAPGTSQLVKRLSTLRVPRNLLSSRNALSLYSQQSGSGQVVGRDWSKMKWPGKKQGRVLRVY